MAIHRSESIPLTQGHGTSSDFSSHVVFCFIRLFLFFSAKSQSLVQAGRHAPHAFACLISVVLPSPGLAAAWTQKADEGLAIFKLGYYSSDRYWDQAGHRQDTPAYRKLEFNPYLEYGLSDRATLGANAFLLRVEQEGGGDHAGLGDMELFLRYRLRTDGWDSLSMQVLVKIPGAYDKDAAVPLGAGQVDAEARVLYGRSGVYESGGRQQPWYYDIEAAYRQRYGQPADEIRLDWALGWQPRPAWTLEFRQENIFAASHQVTTPGSPVSRWSDFDLHKVAVGAVYRISPVLYGNAGIGYDVGGRNAGQGIAPFIAVWKRF